MGDLSGKVAIVTGAGRGLGCEEAKQLARQGASVVVNDIQPPGGQCMAAQVVEEIRAMGGEAVAVAGDCADTDDANRLFATAIETFGDVNIVVNNAGFCRDRTIYNMTDDEFDAVVRVHLRGHFVNMRNAASYWREKAKNGEVVYGRLISTSSEAMFGSIGQPNYAAAKAGITAMTISTARLLIKYGVTCNVIMPRARTAMTAFGATAESFAAPEDPGEFDMYNPENVAPLVGYLASPKAGHISGEVLLVWGGEVTVLRPPTWGESFQSSNGGRWEPQDMHAALTEYFNTDYTPVQDGYSVF
ncbi:MAG: SDR family oxidoreductase [Halioglobus sp.]|nr:SDR family oxidoreductase [Halioglobus sp.]